MAMIFCRITYFKVDFYDKDSMNDRYRLASALRRTSEMKCKGPCTNYITLKRWGGVGWGFRYITQGN